MPTLQSCGKELSSGMSASYVPYCRSRREPERPSSSLSSLLLGSEFRFDRYHIVSPGDLQEAVRRLTGTFSGTSGSAQVDGPRVTP